MNILETAEFTKQIRALVLSAAEVASNIAETDPEQAKRDLGEQFDEWLTSTGHAKVCADHTGNQHMLRAGDIIYGKGEDFNGDYLPPEGSELLVVGFDEDGDIKFYCPSTDQDSWTYSTGVSYRTWSKEPIETEEP